MSRDPTEMEAHSYHYNIAPDEFTIASEVKLAGNRETLSISAVFDS